uniref:Uncharacterized protein n=1 Tax=Panagrolaimus superbus TaxID=310955 RepID=A0A914Z080_9BILA
MSTRRQGSSPLTPSRQPSFTNGNISHHSFPNQHNYNHHPHPQPPSIPPPPVSSCVSSANSSQHGYYSSSTSSMGRSNGTQSRELPSSSSTTGGPQRRGSFIGKHSLSSRAQSFDDDEDDGFYDNIQVDDRRFSEADNASILSHQLPPTQKGGTGRLGQLIRRIGGRPPSSTANTSSSSMSLNKMGIDGISSNGSSSGHHHQQQQHHHHPLMKSNSLSNEPWRAQIIEGDKRASHPGIGYRLKQSIFGGSKKRLN